MPTEIRRIIFEDAEVIGAIRGLFDRLSITLPRGTIIGLSFVDEGGGRADLVIADDDGQRQVLSVDREKLAAALILFCRSKKIPIPKDSTKIFKQLNGKLALVVARNVPPADLDRLSRET